MPCLLHYRNLCVLCFHSTVCDIEKVKELINHLFFLIPKYKKKGRKLQHLSLRSVAEVHLLCFC